MPVAEETKDLLEQVKKGKSRKFVLLTKGASIINFVVYKKGAVSKYIKEAKEAGTGTLCYGTIEGRGPDVTLKLATVDGFKEPPVKDVILKKYLQEEADFKCVPTIQIVEVLPVVLDENDPLHAKFMKLEKLAQEAGEKSPDRAAALKTVCRQAAGFLDGDQREQAEAKIAELESLLQTPSGSTASGSNAEAAAGAGGSPPPNPPSSSPPVDKNKETYGMLREKLEPLLLQAQKAQPEKATAFGNVWNYSETQAEQGNYPVANKALAGLADALKKAISEAPKTDTEKFGIQQNIVGDRQAQLQFDKDYGSLKDRIAVASNLQNAVVSTKLKEAAAQLSLADGQVTDKVSEGKYGEASGLLGSLKVAELLAGVEKLQKEYETAKSDFEKGFGAVRSEIEAVQTGWGDDISPELKDKRTALDNAAKLVVAQESGSNYVEANQIFVDQKVAELLNAAKSAKTTFDQAKLDYEKDYNPLRPRLQEVLYGWGPDISVKLTELKNAVDSAATLIAEQADAFDYPKAKELLASQELAKKIGDAEAGKLLSDEAAARVKQYFIDNAAKLTEVVDKWKTNLTTTMTSARTAVVNARDAVTAEQKKFEYVAADGLLAALGTKISDAFSTGLKDARDAYDAAAPVYNNLLKHPQEKIVSTRTADLYLRFNTVDDHIKKERFGDAMVLLGPIKTDCADCKTKLDGYAEYVKAAAAAQKLVDEMANWTAMNLQVADCEDKLKKAKTEAGKFDFGKSQSLIDEVSDCYKNDFPTVVANVWRSTSNSLVDTLKKHTHKSVIADEIKTVSQQLSDAADAYNNGLYTTSSKLILKVRAGCRAATAIADAYGNYLTEYRKVETKVQDLRTRVQPGVAGDVSDLEKQLADAAKLALPGARRYAEAMQLLSEIDAASPAIKKVLDAHDKTAKEKENTLKQAPAEAIKALRKQIAEIKKLKPDEIPVAVKDELEAAEKKLEEADKALVTI